MYKASRANITTYWEAKNMNLKVILINNMKDITVFEISEMQLFF